VEALVLLAVHLLLAARLHQAARLLVMVVYVIGMAQAILSVPTLAVVGAMRTMKAVFLRAPVALSKV